MKLLLIHRLMIFRLALNLNTATIKGADISVRELIRKAMIRLNYEKLKASEELEALPELTHIKVGWAKANATRDSREVALKFLLGLVQNAFMMRVAAVLAVVLIGNLITMLFYGDTMNYNVLFIFASVSFIIMLILVFIMSKYSSM